MNIAQKLIENAENAVIDALLVPNSWLPVGFQGKKSHRKLRSVVNQSKRQHANAWKNPRDVSVKFDSNQNIVSATPERLAAIQSLRDQADAIGKIDDSTTFEFVHDVNEDLQYNHLMKWASALVAGGILSADDFDSE